MTTSFADRFVTLPGNLMGPEGQRTPVQVSLYWSTGNPLSYVIGVRHPGEKHDEAWEVARSLFVAADTQPARGAYCGGGDFSIGYGTTGTQAVLWFKPSYLEQAKWAQVIVAAPALREFVNATFAPTTRSVERVVIERQIDDAIARCLADA